MQWLICSLSSERGSTLSVLGILKTITMAEEVCFTNILIKDIVYINLSILFFTMYSHLYFFFHLYLYISSGLPFIDVLKCLNKNHAIIFCNNLNVQLNT